MGVYLALAHGKIPISEKCVYTRLIFPEKRVLISLQNPEKCVILLSSRGEGGDACEAKRVFAACNMEG